MRTASADLHTLTGAYAVNALSDIERAAFVAHLTRCQSCAIEVTELAATAARLGVAVESPPPPQLRARVLAAAAETRQLSPHTARVPDPRRKRWAGGLLAAACLVAAVFVTVQYSQSDQERQLAQLSSEYSRFSDFLSTPDAKLINGRAANGATGTAVVSASRDEALFLARDLPQAPDGHTYQLWRIGADGDPHPAGLLDSRSSPVVVSGLTGTQEIALTVEPSGGSEQPTTPVVMAMPVG
ncbi:Anti-sigma-K factor RskA [Lentzea albidocapillata subsp. violacea]|uniref:Regulator of SigK n=1 Tax=Lentzea albidocapillata subsp. violacea TaxID=128104 RepID=A0A1G9JLH4_9PSEU|nr:anti-sigma factor [Lentzea albidocapillata]SDL38450.1 Anti-sigma-K factor RskA [Lentzea albidocapillata subsp. violacea]